MEKAWQDTGMLAEAVLHAHAQGRPTLRNLVQSWNQMLQREIEPTPSQKTDATAAFLASLEEPKLTSLADAGKKPPIEILPPGMASLNAPPITIQKKPGSAAQNSQQPGKPLAIEAPPTATTVPESATQTQQPEATGAPVPDPSLPEATSDSTSVPEDAPPKPESGETVVDNGHPTPASASDGTPTVNGETVQAEPASNPSPPEVPSPVVEAPEANAPNTTTVPATNAPSPSIVPTTNDPSPTTVPPAIDPFFL
ncbi:PREDICTED: proteoglycan 4-like [Lupinus angustifolius]|nr:PREDICTED: proteoglycan 4-like [Lupinus angustifolius]